MKLQNATNSNPIKGYSIIAEFYFNFSSRVSPLYNCPRSISRYLPQAGFAPAFIVLHYIISSFIFVSSATALLPQRTSFQCLERLSVILHLMSMSFEFVICNYNSKIIYYVSEQKIFLIVGAKMTSRLLDFFFYCD